MPEAASEELSTDDRRLVADVLLLMGVRGDPSLREFTQACRIIERVFSELNETRDGASWVH